MGILSQTVGPDISFVYHTDVEHSAVGSEVALTVGAYPFGSTSVATYVVLFTFPVLHFPTQIPVVLPQVAPLEGSFPWGMRILAYGAMYPVSHVVTCHHT